MTNELVVIINSLKVPKIKKILLHEMKFRVPNYSSVLCPQLNLLNPPRKKFLGTPLSMLMILIYWTEVYILEREKKTEALTAASKEINPELNADKTKYMVMSRDKISRRCHNMEIVPLKWWKSPKFGNNINKPKFYSERN